MPKCKSCNESGLFLRLDFDGLCDFCHSRQSKALADRLTQLESFYETYSCIPSAQAEANRIRLDSSRQAESIIADAKEQADRIVSKAHAQSAQIVVDNARR